MKKVFSAITALLLPLAVKAQDLGGGLLDSAAGSKGAGYRKMQIEQIVGNVISIVLGIVGVVFLVLTIYGGYMWMTAGGDEGKVEKARDTMTRAIIGLIIVLAAYALTYFVVSQLVVSTLTS